MANNDVQHLLDMLYEMIDGAKNAPLSSDRCILNRDEALDLLDEIRAQLPVELARAQELIRAKEDYVKAAKRKCSRKSTRTGDGFNLHAPVMAEAYKILTRI